ncbi:MULTISPECIES: nucleotide-binding protein [Bacillus cereus group]|uniref:nucleotide-binding protein n=1 Tax=Bacillus cereus group TaxID=86661 RepID=UPI001F0A49A9|nr:MULTISPECIES: nucleotide-binding protein [Bacillus cereus group]
MKSKKAFYAYSSNSDDLLEDIREAVKLINDSQDIEITTWEKLSIGGKYIIDGILSAIERCDLFICDLTYLNFNVLYELGYAISKKKKIWITLNTSHDNAVANYKSLSIMSTIGYSGYENSQQLAEKFFSDVPHEYSKTIDIKPNKVDISKNILHLKCEANTNSSNIVNSILNKAKLPRKVDDPYEGVQPLNWYLNLLPNSLGVIVHFHKMNTQKESQIITARKALVAGLSNGLGIKTLLLAHAPYNPPLDYQDILKVHSNSTQCEEYLKEFLQPILEEHRDSEEEHREYRAELKALGKLSNLIMGDYVAENENQDLMEYFLQTAEYKEALTAQQVLFVGRKGTGKTANLIKLKNDLSVDKRNFIITIQPQGHEFEGVLGILKTLQNSSEQGHLIESIWKYLIYTEMAKQYFDYLEDQPLHRQRTEEEVHFIDFVKQNERFINADFTLRLENIVSNLNSLDQVDSMEQQRLKVSEFLHDTMIRHLRDHLGILLNKKEKVSILIDNLDKSWNDNADLEHLSNLLFGLLNVIHKITAEFHRSTYKHVSVNLSLIVFLRSDIFSRIMSYAPERDKIPIKHLTWSEPRLLFRIIENRIDYSSNSVSSPEELWGKYFCEKVDGLPLKDYIEKLIIPRPRDIIFLFKSALQEAVNRGHTLVEDEDFKSAERSYSEYALQSLFPENGNRVEDLESILYEFAGENSIINQEELEECLQRNSVQNIPEIIGILCDMTFLGQEVQEGKFEYYNEKRPKQITDKLAQRLSVKKARSKRYTIHPAFHEYLSIEKV